MALFDFLKRKKKEPEKKIEKKEEVKIKPLEKKEEVKTGPPKAKKKVSDQTHRILYSPHITEKATDSGKENKYVFKVWPGANKNEVKEVVENTYGVDIVGVRIINVPKRKRRLGKMKGWKKGYKKAIVKVKEGQKIEILPR